VSFAAVTLRVASQVFVVGIIGSCCHQMLLHFQVSEVQEWEEVTQSHIWCTGRLPYSWNTVVR
jgi:hypothetical protein